MCLGRGIQSYQNVSFHGAYNEVSNFPDKSIITSCDKCRIGEGQAVMRDCTRRT